MGMEKFFTVLPCTEEQKVLVSTYSFEGEAYRWWWLIKDKHARLTWDGKAMEFTGLKKRNMTVVEYQAKVTELAHHTWWLLKTRRQEKFENGLDWNVGS